MGSPSVRSSLGCPPPGRRNTQRSCRTRAFAGGDAERRVPGTMGAYVSWEVRRGRRGCNASSCATTLRDRPHIIRSRRGAVGLSSRRLCVTRVPGKQLHERSATGRASCGWDLPAEAIAELRAMVMRPDLERLGRFDERVRQRLRDSFSPRHTSVISAGEPSRAASSCGWPRTGSGWSISISPQVPGVGSRFGRPSHAAGADRCRRPAHPSERPPGQRRQVAVRAPRFHGEGAGPDRNLHGATAGRGRPRNVKRATGLQGMRLRAVPASRGEDSDRSDAACSLVRGLGLLTGDVVTNGAVGQVQLVADVV